MYVLYTAADLLIMQGTMRSLFSLGSDASLVVIALATLVIAYIGYELIHRIGKVMTILSGGLFAAGAVLLYAHHRVGGAGGHPVDARIIGMAFSLTMTQAAAWSFSYGPYVADYSRDPPPDVSAAKTFWSTALGCFLGSTLIMVFGAYLALNIPGLGANPAAAVTGLFGPARPVAQVLLILAIVYGNVMNVYSAYMSSCTILSGFNHMSRVGNAFKLAVMSAIMAAAIAVSIGSQDNFQGHLCEYPERHGLHAGAGGARCSISPTTIWSARASMTSGRCSTSTAAMARIAGGPSRCFCSASASRRLSWTSASIRVG